MTVWVAIECPHCHSTEVTKYGKSPLGKQRYRCQNTDCPYRTFVLTQADPGRTQRSDLQLVNAMLNAVDAIAKEQEPTAQKPVALLTQANEKLQQRDHTQKAILQAEQARLQELAKANEVLKKSLDSLAKEPSLDKFLGIVLGAIAAQFNSSLAEYWYHQKNTAFVGMMSWQGQTYNRAEISKLYPTHPGVDGFQVLPEMIHGEDLHHRQQHFITEDWLTEPFVKHVKWMSDNGLYKHINVPIVFGDECIGALIVRMSREHQITTGQIELAQTLANQATLAAQLTRLAEEVKQAAIAREQEKAANERVAELAKANEALKNSLTLLADEPSLDKFLGYVLQTIADRFGDRSGAVYLYSEPHNTTLLHLNYENGHLQQGDRITHPAATLPQPPRAWDDQYLPVLRHNQLLIHHASEFESPAYAPYRQHHKDWGIQTVLIVPMMFGSRLLGSLTLRSTQHRKYTPEELELARALAQQATLAVQLTQLADQRRQTAILEERNRFAREIHDTIAQGLSGIVIQLQAAEAMSDDEAHQEHLIQARQLAELSLTEARRSVQALRTSQLDTDSLADALTTKLHELTRNWEVKSTFQVRGTPYPLRLDVENHLFRIAIEGITNTLKHAQATKLCLKLIYKPREVQLIVQDNGLGFDPDRTLTSSYGIVGMRERSQKIGANLAIASLPGAGTTIEVVLPILLSAKRS